MPSYGGSEVDIVLNEFLVLDVWACGTAAGAGRLGLTLTQALLGQSSCILTFS